LTEPEHVCQEHGGEEPWYNCPACREEPHSYGFHVHEFNSGPLISKDPLELGKDI
jgi:hypothetical protein